MRQTLGWLLLVSMGCAPKTNLELTTPKPFSFVVETSVWTVGDDAGATATARLAGFQGTIPLASPDVTVETERTTDTLRATVRGRIATGDVAGFWTRFFDGAWKFLAGLGLGSAV